VINRSYLLSRSERLLESITTSHIEGHVKTKDPEITEPVNPGNVSMVGDEGEVIPEAEVETVTQEMEV